MYNGCTGVCELQQLYISITITSSECYKRLARVRTHQLGLEPWLLKCENLYIAYVLTNVTNNKLVIVGSVYKFHLLTSNLNST